MGTLSRKADDKKAKKGKNNSKNKESYSHMPPEYLCQLTRKPMSDPVKTIYNNVYDRAAISKWLSTQGKICPLTGMGLFFDAFLYVLIILVMDLQVIYHIVVEFVSFLYIMIRHFMI